MSWRDAICWTCKKRFVLSESTTHLPEHNKVVIAARRWGRTELLPDSQAPRCPGSGAAL